MLKQEDTVLENEYCRLWHEGDIACCEIKSRRLDLEAAQELIKARYQAFSGQDYLSMIDIRKVTSVSKEARDLFASSQGTTGLRAAALVSNGVISKMLALFFMTFSKPPVPIQLFSDKAEALKWLAGFEK